MSLRDRIARSPHGQVGIASDRAAHEAACPVGLAFDHAPAAAAAAERAATAG